MEELNLYHLIKEHPLISFLTLAIPVVLLTFYLVTSYMTYRENRQIKEKKEIKEK